MPAPYGVTATGFSTKTLAEQLAEIEIAEQAAFGAGVVISAQSPLGQINGLFADAVAEIWEMAQALYGSLDVDQATGARLDMLGRLRGVTRGVGQSDTDFRLAITADGFSDIGARDLRQRLLNVTGVTSVWVIENASDAVDGRGVPGHSLAISVVGGTDAAVAQAIWDNTVAGIGLIGNTQVSATIDGVCRTIAFIRPTSVPLSMSIGVSANTSSCECAPASVATIQQAIVNALTDPCSGAAPGGTLSPNDIAQLIMNKVSGVNVESVLLARDGGTPADQNVAFNAEEVPTATVGDIAVSFVTGTVPATTSGSTGGTGFVIGGIV